MHLLRKYPCKRHLVALQEKNSTHFLLGYNHLDGPFDTLLVLKDRLTPYLAEFKLNNTHKYRYYRLFVKGLHALNIAEFELLGKKVSTHKCVRPMDLPVLSEQQNLSIHAPELYRIEGTPQRTGPMHPNAYDKNPDTYVESAYLGMDYKTPVCISRIRLMPRNAMNIIEPGHRYKLLYYKNGKWKEHQTLVSAFNYLDFENVPAGTIYWLRNLDKGKEELPFLYEDGKQIFINEYM